MIILTVIWSLPYEALAKDKKTPSLKLIVKNSSEIREEIAAAKNIIDKLAALAKNMEKTAKLYDTINQKSYWESQAKIQFLKALHAEGYYGASIETEFPENENSIIFYVGGLSRYKIRQISIRSAENSNKYISLPDLANFKEFGVKEGEFAMARNIIAAQNSLINYIEQNNCVLFVKADHQAVIDHTDDTIDLSFIVNGGPDARVGQFQLRGLEKVEPEYVKKLMPFKRGMCFRQSMIGDAERALHKSGLFALAIPKVPDSKDGMDGNAVPIDFELRERQHRSIKAGLNYGTDLGFGITTGWHHRNFLGSGEKVDLEVFANYKEQSVDLNFSKPFFLRDDQTLKLGLSGENLKSRAFRSKEGSLSASVERKLDKLWTAGIGSKYSYSIVREKGQEKNFSFISIPLFVKFDTRDNFLNPRKGQEFALKGEPFSALGLKGNSFFKSELVGNQYFGFNSALKPVIALRVAIGSITGIKRTSIPANERFYMGGAQSVRGYAYQLAGEVDQQNRPIGGRSYLGTSLELRTRIKGSFGVIAFTDSGNSFGTTMPRINEKMFNGVGFGLRYFTDFGPLRFDVGFPLKKRPKIDKSFQIYFGIGQSF